MTASRALQAYGADVVSSGPLPLTASVLSATQVALTFIADTVGPGGLLLRTSGAVRQICAVGQTQIAGNPTSAVPLSQCGPATGFEIGDAAGRWTPVDSIARGTAPNVLELTFPAAAGAPARLRYLFADWPTPTVYNSQSFLGTNGELPTPPFEIEFGR